MPVRIPESSKIGRQQSGKAQRLPDRANSLLIVDRDGSVIGRPRCPSPAVLADTEANYRTLRGLILGTLVPPLWRNATSSVRSPIPSAPRGSLLQALACLRLGDPRHRRSADPSLFCHEDRANCFNYRNEIGCDIALEALRKCLKQRTATTADVWEAAKACRVANVMKPYMEALV